MYFWKIDKLKEDLKKSSLSESESFKYMLATTILYGVAMIPNLQNNIWDVYNAIIIGILTVGSVIYAYKCNGGEKGKNFLQRYISLAWVLGIRWLVTIAVPAIIVYLTLLAMYKGLPESTTPYDVVVPNLLYLSYVWLLGKHMKELAK